MKYTVIMSYKYYKHGSMEGRIGGETGRGRGGVNDIISDIISDQETRPSMHRTTKKETLIILIKSVQWIPLQPNCLITWQLIQPLCLCAVL